MSHATDNEQNRNSSLSKIGVFSAKAYDRDFLNHVNKKYGLNLVFHSETLTEENWSKADQYEIICSFVEDKISKKMIEKFQRVKLIALRCAGTDSVDRHAAEDKGIAIRSVPAYNPDAIAEHAVAMMLALARHIPRAILQMRQGNFELNDLVGFTLRGKTVGIIGTGKIGQKTGLIMKNGFGCKLLAYDIYTSDNFAKQGAEYVELDKLLRQSDIISLHAPLTKETRHLIDAEAIRKMKRGVMLINTSRGALVDSVAAVKGVKTGHIGTMGLDVYEEEEGVYFEDHRTGIIQDDVLMRLLMLPNVLITGHQAFLTREALENIAESTLRNIKEYIQEKEGASGKAKRPSERGNAETKSGSAKDAGSKKAGEKPRSKL